MPRSRSYLPRILDAVLAERLHSAGAVLLEGPKACGKTSTAVRHANSSVFLDRDPGAMAAAGVAPDVVLKGAAPLLVDEWQLAATSVWNHVRAEVDRRSEPGQFILTGSATPDDDARRHSGAGRFARLLMRPMSLFESGDSPGTISLADLMAGSAPAASSALTVPDLVELVVRGGWPTNIGLPIKSATRANVDYLKTIAEVDISRVDASRRNPQLALRVMAALARNVAMEENKAKIAAEAGPDSTGISRPTAYAYLEALERLLIIEPQPPWSTHIRSRARLREKPRTHFIDPSLAVAALGSNRDRLLADLNTFGYFFESLVVRDLRIYADAVGGSVTHYRDSNGLEVDLVVETSDGSWGAFEVKLGGDAAIDSAAASLLKFARTVNTVKVGAPAVLAVVTGGLYGYTRPDGVAVIPIGALGP